MSRLLDIVLAYAASGWAVFPCNENKVPLTANGVLDATTEAATIAGWRTRWPHALIGLATGRNFAVLDIDIKHVEPRLGTGFDVLAELTGGIWPATPTVHTRSGGCHLYFALPTDREIRNTQGSVGRGIGHGLDWRGLHGYVIAPPSSGYSWDPALNLDTVPLAPVPPALLPREPERIVASRPVRPSSGLSVYAEAALRKACANIVGAPPGEQEATLHREVFSIATLAGSGGIPEQFARRELLFAASQLCDYDHRRPWRAIEISQKVTRSFASGLTHPR